LSEKPDSTFSHPALAPLVPPARPVKPKAASSLVLVDTTQSIPRVLMGRRNASLRFMPDRDIMAADALDDSVAARLGKRNRRDAPEPRTLALAAIRETFEETGLVIGEKAAPSETAVPQSWRSFIGLGFLPKIGDLRFLARAVTPQHLPRRFDTRFFIADAASIAYRVDGVAHADAELVELLWLPIAEALQLDLGNITGSVLREAAQRFTAGLKADLPAAFFSYRNRRFSRDEL
jgi:8-oxo-dGTP pyrophosphatase MutT (NUDIX family)